MDLLEQFPAVTTNERVLVAILATLQSIDQKLGWLADQPQGLLSQIEVEQPSDTPNEVFEDEDVIVKGLTGDEFKVSMDKIGERNPKTARAVRIARALDEPFQVYVIGGKEVFTQGQGSETGPDTFGIVVGSETKAHIEHLKSQGTWQ